MNRKEVAVICVLTIIAVAFIFSFHEASKENAFYDILSKFSFAVLISVIARILSVAFTTLDEQKEKEREAYKNFLQFGMRNIHNPLTDFQLSDILANSRKIKILKTWFPENPTIAAGLHTAIKNKASLQLLLLEPKSFLIKKRSVGANKAEKHGSVKVIEALKNIYDWVGKEKSWNKLKIGLYNEWAGCPVIWCNEQIFMGFYFRGNSSDCFPWIEVRRGSQLEEILVEQFDSLWENSNNSEKLGNSQEWLEKNIS